VLRAACVAAGRSDSTVDTAVALADAGPGDLARVEDLGVDELVVVAAPPADPVEAGTWVDELGERWNTGASVPP
jgi:hypothetical protein